MKYLRSHKTQSQEKRKEEEKNLFKPTPSLSNISNKKSKEIQLELKAQYYVKKIGSLSKYQKSMFNTFFSMFDRYKHKKLYTSQGWLAKATDCCRNTAITATNIFRDNKLIHKKNRGQDTRRGYFFSYTCEYSFDKKLLEDFKSIVKVLPKSNKFCQQIMALIPLFVTFWAPTLLSLNYNVNITSNKYIRSNNTTVFGEYNYEISKISKDLPRTHTTTVPIEHLDSIFTPEHQANITQEIDYNTLIKLDHLHDWFEDTLKGKGIDLRFCKESDYKMLCKKGQTISHAFFNGKKVFGSLSAYQDKLLKLNKNNLQTLYLKWILLHYHQNNNKLLVNRYTVRPDRGVTVKKDLTQKQIESIKKFGERILVRVRGDILHEPDKKNNYRWIFEKCMFYKNNYKKNNYISVEERKYHEKEQLEYERSKYPFKPFKANNTTLEKKQENKELQVSDDFIKIIGEENFLAYTKRCKFI